MNTAVPVTAYVGIGANLGDAVASVKQAFESLQQLESTRSARLSGLYRSAPVGTGGPDYINAVAEIRTVLPALDLLQALQQIEAGAGRTRPYRWAPRTLDLDMLFYGQDSIDLPTLTVPHPRLHQRAFVLFPLAELAPLKVPASLLSAVCDQVISRI